MKARRFACHPGAPQADAGHGPLLAALLAAVLLASLVPAAARGAPPRDEHAPADATSVQPVTADLAWNAQRPPRYPLEAAARAEQGTVCLNVLVGADGLPLAIVPHLTPDHARLAEAFVAAAVKAAAGWRFHPARRGGRAVESWVEIPVQFTIPGLVRNSRP